MRKGKKGIKVDEKEKTIFCSGDLPLGTNIDQFRIDTDFNKYDAVVNLNSMENIYGDDFKSKKRVNGSMIGPYRRWHLPLKDTDNENKVHWIKENNLWVFNIDESLLKIINTAYGGRKQYDDKPGENNKKGGRWNTIKELGLKDGKWYKLLKEVPLVFPYLLIRGLTSYNPALISFDGVSNFASIGLERKVKVKATHSDFGFLNDIDSVEDIIFNEMMMHSVDPSSLYPYWDQLKDFGNHLKKQEIAIVNQFPKYMNDWFSNFSNLQGKEMFNLNGVFQDTELTKSMRDNVDLAIINRQKYVKDNTSDLQKTMIITHNKTCQHYTVTNKQNIYK